MTQEETLAEAISKGYGEQISIIENPDTPAIFTFVPNPQTAQEYLTKYYATS